MMRRDVGIAGGVGLAVGGGVVAFLVTTGMVISLGAGLAIGAGITGGFAVIGGAVGSATRKIQKAAQPSFVIAGGSTKEINVLFGDNQNSGNETDYLSSNYADFVKEPIRDAGNEEGFDNLQPEQTVDQVNDQVHERSHNVRQRPGNH